MENERELLELAAKACGVDGYEWCEAWKCMAFWYGAIDGFERSTCWNPKRGDGDCARMEAALGISIDWSDTNVMCGAWNGAESESAVERFESHKLDKQAARRMASLRVAAEIGRAMKSDKR